ncbi:hypothetical protein PENSTE_c006G01992 [Penicillium steckii]|uniref:cystathionine gamma-lyase n=1 Tax=Penicillium steckii TaxID=303698 RepID=A0A1V6THW7_9EURO|nr:hypothetical protein PENSTE_c006G01992 [Penicillium steckii]
MAATTSVIQGLAANSNVIAMVTFVHDIQTELSALLDESEGKTATVWIESPSNPTLTLIDIEAVSSIAHARGSLVVVDNTFLPRKVIALLPESFDAWSKHFLHSVAKYINGHSNVLMGVVALNCFETHRKLSFMQNAAGGVPSSFDCWLAHRGLKTLHLRAPAAARNALAVAN